MSVEVTIGFSSILLEINIQAQPHTRSSQK